jgi:hypothetical protein
VSSGPRKNLVLVLNNLSIGLKLVVVRGELSHEAFLLLRNDGFLLLGNPGVWSTTTTTSIFDPEICKSMTNDHSDSSSGDASTDSKENWNNDSAGKTPNTIAEVLVFVVAMRSSTMVGAVVWARLAVVRAAVMVRASSSELVVAALDPSGWLAVLRSCGGFLGLPDSLLDLLDDHGLHAAKGVLAVHANGARGPWGVHWNRVDHNEGNVAIIIYRVHEFDGVNVDLTTGKIKDRELEDEPVMALVRFVGNGLKSVSHTDWDGVFKEIFRIRFTDLRSEESV